MKRCIRLVARSLPWLGLAAAALPQTARAHIDMAGALQGRGGDQKSAPCEGQPRGSGTVYMFEPGATITIGVSEGVAHDGYFRIAFDDDGEDGFVDPVSIDPINPDRYGTGQECEGTAADHCGESDFCNVVSTDGGPTVLWDNLDPHIPTSFLDTKEWTWTITLPDVECENCTLQIMQVMEDPPGHGPFDGTSDLYYRCVDIVLRAGVGTTPGTTTAPATNDGIECATTATPDGGITEPPDAGPSAGTGGMAPNPSGQAGNSGGSAAPIPNTSAGTGAGTAGTSAAGAGGTGTVAPVPMTPNSSSDSSGGCSAAPGTRTRSGVASSLLLGLLLAVRLTRRRSTS
jgi:hypothetical protein